MYKPNNNRKISRRKKAAAVLIILASGYLSLMTQSPKLRRWWVRPWLEEKDAGLKLVKREFKRDAEQFKKFLRMPESIFEKVLKLVAHRIAKKNTNFRDAVSPRDKLIVTLRFLATGESYRSLMYNFRISESTISLFVPVVCREIYEALKDDYLKVSF